MAYGTSPAASDLEKGANAMEDLSRSRTVGGHANDTSQPALPTVHRRFANPAPLGLYSFATGVFLISIFGLQTRGIQEPNIIVGVLLFFTGFCQYISGIMEFVAGNTFGATVFPAYASLSLSYAMIYLPGTGIMAAYTEQQQFSEAVALYLFSWFILTTLFCVSAMRSSLILLLALIFFDLELLLLGCGFLLQNHGLLTAGYSMGFVAGFWAYWAGSSGMWAGDLTPINLPTFALYKKD